MKLATKYKVETRLQNQNRIKAHQVTRLNLSNHVLWAIKNSKVFKNIRTVCHHEKKKTNVETCWLKKISCFSY